MLTKKYGRVFFVFLSLSIIHMIQSKLESYVIPHEKKHIANYLNKWALNNTSRDVVHNFLRKNISPRVRRLYGNITIDYNLCGAVRKEITFRTRTEPRNQKRAWVIKLLFYQRKIEKKLQNGQFTTFYDVGPFICCDKATRSDKTLLVMCGVMSSPTNSKNKDQDAAVGENAQWQPLHFEIEEKKPLDMMLLNGPQRNEGSFAAEGALELGQIITLL